MEREAVPMVRCVRVLECESGVQAVDWSPDGTRLIDIVWSVAFSPDATRLVSASSDTSVRIWDVSALLQVRARHAERASFEAYVARQAASVGRRTGKAALSSWVPEIRSLQGKGHFPGSVAIFSDNRTAALGSDDGSVRRVDLETGAETWRGKEQHERDVHAITLSKDERLVASSSHDNTVRIWESVSGRCLAHFTKHGGAVWRSSFSPSGELVASASDDRTVRIWDPGSGKPISKLIRHSGSVAGVDWHPNGALIASGSGQPAVRIWSAHDGAEVCRHQVHQEPVWAVSWSPDVWSLSWAPSGAFLAASIHNDIVRIWDTGELLHPRSRPTRP